MDQNQTQNQSQSQVENQQDQSQGQRVNPLQILVNAAFIAYNKGAFSMREASIISQSIDFFVETKQAVVPQFMPQQVPQTPTPTPTPTPQSTENLPTIPEETPQKVTFVSQ
jgi:hypothetical protein